LLKLLVARCRANNAFVFEEASGKPLRNRSISCRNPVAAVLTPRLTTGLAMAARLDPCRGGAPTGRARGARGQGHAARRRLQRRRPPFLLGPAVARVDPFPAAIVAQVGAGGNAQQKGYVATLA
jgi:hypothetical protein